MNLIRLVAFAILAYGTWRFAHGVKGARRPPGKSPLEYEPLRVCSACAVRVPAGSMDAIGRCQACASSLGNR